MICTVREVPVLYLYIFFCVGMHVDADVYQYSVSTCSVISKQSVLDSVVFAAVSKQCEHKC
jgi:hypothetical protein